MSQNSGISTLLEAEKEAAKLVAKARNYRVNKLKDAKMEAQKEIEGLKIQKEKEYQQFMEKMKEEGVNRDADADTEQKLKDIKAMVDKNKDTVVEKVLETIVRVEPKIHKNYKYQ